MFNEKRTVKQIINENKENTIMKKTYKIDVDCANCANKMEDAAKNTAGVKDATVNFMTLKMSVEFEEGQDAKAVMQEVLKNCKKVEARFSYKLPGAGMTNDIISMPAL